jgi:hypothetical protein
MINLCCGEVKKVEQIMLHSGLKMHGMSGIFLEALFSVFCLMKAKI